MAGDKPIFDWSDREAVVVKGREAIAVYQNGDGGITIRMEASAGEDEDHIVFFSADDARAARVAFDAAAVHADPALSIAMFPDIARRLKLG